MRLYVESNFVLELAFQQEQCAECEQLIGFAKEAQLELVLPSFCIAEPQETLVRRHKTRRSLQGDVQAELRQLSRSSGYRDIANQVDLASSLFAASAQEDVRRLKDATTQLSTTGRLIPIDSVVVRSAYELQRGFSMGLQDSFVLASVMHDLDKGPIQASAFATRNSKDFDDPDIVTLLADRRCELTTSFGAAIGFVRRNGVKSAKGR